MTGLTPWERIRYPQAGEVISATAEQATATDMDVVLESAVPLYQQAVGRTVGIFSAGSPSITKATLTTVSFTSGTAPFWVVGSPTRITPTIPGIYLIQASVGLNYTSTSNMFRIMIARNGGTAAPDVQIQTTPQWDTNATIIVANMVSMWKFATGDFYELKVFWNGTPAGPQTLDTPRVSLIPLMYT